METHWIFLSISLSSIILITLVKAIQNQMSSTVPTSPLLLPAQYSELENLLKVNNWKKANDKTTELILKAAGQEIRLNEGVEDLKYISCTDLKNINDLWLKYSKKHFGFSSQKHLYQREKDFKKFSDLIEWRVRGKWLRGDEIWKRLENEHWMKTPTGYLPLWGSLPGLPKVSDFGEKLVSCPNIK